MWIMIDKVQAQYATISLYNLEKKLPVSKDNTDAFEWLRHCLSVLIMLAGKYRDYDDVGTALKKLQKLDVPKSASMYHKELIIFFKKIHIGTAEASYNRGDRWGGDFWTDSRGELSANYTSLKNKYEAEKEFKYEDSSDVDTLYK